MFVATAIRIGTENAAHDDMLLLSRAVNGHHSQHSIRISDHILLMDRRRCRREREEGTDKYGSNGLATVN